ncbi:hypothetical protein JCM16303_000101 [Sporobolomyces ruberrimus]
MPDNSRRTSVAEKTGAEIKREKEVRLIKIAIAVTSVYMLVELVVGYSFSALVLVADAYHMLNDLVAFIVQLYADEIGGMKRESSKDDSGFTYGFSRVAFVANLINGVILIALCLTLGLESIQRLYSPETMTLPPLVAGLGGLALVWNVIMFRMFSDAHTSGSKSLCHPSLFRRRMIQTGISTPSRLARHAEPLKVEHALSQRSSSSRRSSAHGGPDLAHSNVKEHKSALAIHAITAGNIAVIVDGLISIGFGPKIGKVSGLIKPWKGIGYIDPLASLVVTYVILMHSFPLVTASSYALMQAFDPVRAKTFRNIFRSQTWVPRSIRERFVVGLVDLHIWSLSKEDHIATIKFEVSSKGGDSTIDLSDLSTIEQAAKEVLAQAKIKEEMM